VSLPGTDQVIDLARHAEKAGADAVISTVPYYWPCSEEAQFEHFAALGSAIGIPLVAYNSPRAQSGPNLSPRLLVRLIERLDNFVGLKDASFNFEYFIEARRQTQAVRPDFGIFTGIEFVLPAIVLGGIGSMSIISGVTPKVVRTLYNTVVKGQYEKARPLQERVSQLLHLLRVEYPATIKAGMEIMGRPVGKVRLPIRSLSEEAKRRLREELAKLGVLDQEPHGW
jgi:4-hydroxy-tetrahydrodipicolinate synthase